MLSRVAESVYWMARYIERAENVARFIHVNVHLALDSPIDAGEQWMPLVTTTGDHEQFQQQYGQATRENVMRFLTFDASNPNSILSCIRQARENARTVREVISSEMWEEINRTYLMVNVAARSEPEADSAHVFYTAIKTSSHLFDGLTNATMTHNEAWRFVQLGRFMERADKTSRILDVKYFILLPRPEDVGSPLDNLQWAALLKSASGLQMYRQKYQRIVPERVLQFLLLDEEFPRAILFCLTHAESCLHAISGSSPGRFTNAAERRLGQLRAELAYAQIDEIMTNGLHEFLDEFQGRINEVGEAVFQTFFAIRPVASQTMTTRETS